MTLRASKKTFEFRSSWLQALHKHTANSRAHSLISPNECNSDTTQKLPFALNNTDLWQYRHNAQSKHTPPDIITVGCSCYTLALHLIITSKSVIFGLCHKCIQWAIYAFTDWPPFLFKDKARTAQKTFSVSVVKTDRLMLYMKITLACWDPYKTHEYAVREERIIFERWNPVVPSVNTGLSKGQIMFKNSFLPWRKNKVHLNNKGHSVNTVFGNKHYLFRDLHTCSDVKSKWSYTSTQHIYLHSKNNGYFPSSENN